MCDCSAGARGRARAPRIQVAGDSCKEKLRPHMLRVRMTGSSTRCCRAEASSRKSGCAASRCLQQQ
eukprot:6805470-Prymnesium_polylepis.1